MKSVSGAYKQPGGGAGLPLLAGCHLASPNSEEASLVRISHYSQQSMPFAYEYQPFTVF